MVGEGEHDVAASTDAFAVLDLVVGRRLARRLTTVIDTLGLDADRRRGWLDLARRHALPCVAIAFDTPAGECRARNRLRQPPVPAAVLTAQLRAWAGVKEGLADEGFDAVLLPAAVRVVPPVFAPPRAAGCRRAA